MMRIAARPTHHITNTQAQPVPLLRAAVPGVLVPRRQTEVLEQGSNAGLAFSVLPPIGYVLYGQATATGYTHLGSDSAAVHALGTATVGTATATGMEATGTGAVAVFFLSQELESISQATGTSTAWYRAQSFEVTESETLNTVAVKILKDGSPADNLTIEIHSNATDRPSGTALATSDSVSGATLTGIATWIDFDLTAPLALTADTQYWIVLKRSGAADDTNFYRWRRSSSDAVADWFLSTFTAAWTGGGSSWDSTFRLS